MYNNPVLAAFESKRVIGQSLIFKKQARRNRTKNKLVLAMTSRRDTVEGLSCVPA